MQASKLVNFVPQKLSLYIFPAMSNLIVECFLTGSISSILPPDTACILLSLATSQEKVQTVWRTILPSCRLHSRINTSATGI